MRITTLLALIMSGFACTAQTFEVDTVFKNGNLNERINLVFVGDGYQASELGEYHQDVEEILAELFNQSPFREYKNYFNAFAINVVSNESGAVHPQTSTDNDCAPVPVTTVDNYFGSTFDFANIHRLLVPTKNAVLASVLAECLPQYDQVFILVNSPYYGGSGGQYATGSVHPSGREVAIHEIGHSFGLLGDEYWAGPQYAAEKPNMTQQTNSSLVKWTNWMGENGIGIYSHEESTSWKRPHQSCKMRYLSVPFCSVCTEQFVERIHSLVQPMESYSPAITTLPVPIEDEVLDFSVSLIKPEPNTIQVTWRKNNSFLSNEESISLSADNFIEGGAVISATVIDNSPLTRRPNHQVSHVYVVEWTVGEVVTDVPVPTVESRYVTSVFPNPVDQDLNISYTLYKPTAVTVSILDVSGKKIKTLIRQKQPAGEHQYRFDESNLMQAGEYLVEFKFNNTILTNKIIKK